MCSGISFVRRRVYLPCWERVQPDRSISLIGQNICIARPANILHIWIQTVACAFVFELVAERVTETAPWLCDASRNLQPREAHLFSSWSSSKTLQSAIYGIVDWCGGETLRARKLLVCAFGFLTIHRIISYSISPVLLIVSLQLLSVVKPSSRYTSRVDYLAAGPSLTDMTPHS